MVRIESTRLSCCCLHRSKAAESSLSLRVFTLWEVIVHSPLQWRLRNVVQHIHSLSKNYSGSESAFLLLYCITIPALLLLSFNICCSSYTSVWCFANKLGKCKEFRCVCARVCMRVCGGGLLSFCWWPCLS